MQVRGSLPCGWGEDRKSKEIFFSDKIKEKQKGKIGRGRYKKISKRLGRELREADVMGDLGLLSKGDEVPCFEDVLLT